MWKGALRTFEQLTPPAGQWYRINNGDGSGGSHLQLNTVGVGSSEARADPSVAYAQREADEACDAAATSAAAASSSMLSSIFEPPGSAHALATRPVEGTAVVWYHERRPTEYEPEEDAAGEAVDELIREISSGGEGEAHGEEFGLGADDVAPCQNAAGADCLDWARSGECIRNPSFMRAQCMRSCRACGKSASDLADLPGAQVSATSHFSCSSPLTALASSPLLRRPPRAQEVPTAGETARRAGLEVDPAAWHAGCAVRGGVAVGGQGERWAIQAFKEHPTDGSSPVSTQGFKPAD